MWCVWGWIGDGARPVVVGASTALAWEVNNRLGAVLRLVNRGLPPCRSPVAGDPGLEQSRPDSITGESAHKADSPLSPNTSRLIFLN